MDDPADLEWFDISPPVSSRIAVWPGDTPFRYTLSQRIADGASVELGHIQSTLHVGAHADAPRHYSRGGKSIDACDLGPYYGPCQVVEVSAGPSERIAPSHLREPPCAQRVLFKTGTFPKPERFNRDFAALSPELIAYLAQHQVCLVGIDTPSVDLFDDQQLVAHQALARHAMANLEGIVLAHVEPGAYRLIALPLRLESAGASPVRAVLLR